MWRRISFLHMAEPWQHGFKFIEIEFNTWSIREWVQGKGYRVQGIQENWFRFTKIG
jgi:hypothetical protein